MTPAEMDRRAGVAIRLALQRNYPQLASYVVEMGDGDLDDLRQAATDLADEIAHEQDRRQS
jgi:hypothetical protein